MLHGNAAPKVSTHGAGWQVVVPVDGNSRFGDREDACSHTGALRSLNCAFVIHEPPRVAAGRAIDAGVCFIRHGGVVRGSNRRSRVAAGVALAVLALPLLAVHAWVAWTFPSYLHGQFAQDVVFAFAGCGLLVLVARKRLLHVASVPVAVIAYVAWLFLVLGEGVSYYLQADTFNARFFANLNPANLNAGLRAFPTMIGGGIVLLLVMIAVCIVLLVWVRRRAHKGAARGPVVVAMCILVLTLLGVDSTPRRLVGYLTRVQQSARFADTPQGRAVADLLDLHPVPPKRLVAAPGKNLVFVYLESLERIYWNPKIFPGLTPNLDRLRKQGLDFSGMETFSGATYTIAGMFASQCGVPLFSSPFVGLDAVTGNDTGATTFHPKLTCLGNVLHRAGYTQVYMGGAPISFSNKGLFYRLHGFNEALGLLQLESAHDDKLPESGWGLYDSVLFPLVLKEYEKLEAARKPFNLSMITLDTHPPDGRPSPGCPKYRRNPNSMLQAVHCTDYLVGRFIAKLRQQPDWKNTVVVLMSDHLMMRNDAESLYPKNYYRRPALLVLNAGRGVRPARMYHMDVAPTLLDLMGVRTNATFIAGQERSAPNAQGSQLVDNPVTDAVLRSALWSRVNEFELCKRNTLVGWTRDGGFSVGGRELRMNYLGKAEVGVYGGQVLDFFIDRTNAKLAIAEPDQQATVLAARGDASVLTIRRLPWSHRAAGTFTVDWLGRRGAHAHIADIRKLQGLTITSPHCGAVIARADAAPAGSRLDLRKDFKVATAPVPVMPAAPKHVDFREPGVVAFEGGLGWLPPRPYGSWAIGDAATLEFRTPPGLCKAATLQFRVDPYLPPSRPNLDVAVWVNGKLATTWHFKANGHFSTKASDVPDVLTAAAPVATDGTCSARVELRMTRPGAAQPPYPKAEDPRPLQLRVVGMGIRPAH